MPEQCGQNTVPAVAWAVLAVAEPVELSVCVWAGLPVVEPAGLVDMLAADGWRPLGADKICVEEVQRLRIFRSCVGGVLVTAREGLYLERLLWFQVDIERFKIVKRAWQYTAAVLRIVYFIVTRDCPNSIDVLYKNRLIEGQSPPYTSNLLFCLLYKLMILRLELCDHSQHSVLFALLALKLYSPSPQ